VSFREPPGLRGGSASRDLSAPVGEVPIVPIACVSADADPQPWPPRSRGQVSVGSPPWKSIGRGVSSAVPPLMPLYLDLVRRAVAARTGPRERGARRIEQLAQILRDAEAGKVSIRRCAWCERFQVGREWLHLDAIGSGEQTISAHLLERATHGICPECFKKELKRSAAGRTYLSERSR
jgi:hypothetical protein